MHPLATPVREITANLDSLRDFVDVLGSFLAEHSAESLSTHANSLAPLVLAMDKLAQEIPELGFPALNDEKRDQLQELNPSIKAADVKRDERGAVSMTFQIGGGSKPPQFREAIDALRRARRRTDMLYASSLMNLTSSVELFFSKLLHEFFGLHPEAIGTKEKLFSFDDLSKFDTVADARAHYVSTKIEDLLRGSLAEWLLFAKGTIKLSMGYLEPDQSALEETFQRRNVIVHNGGIVNSIYLSKVAEDERKGVSLGDSVTPNETYLHSRINLWEKNCILLAAELWKKLDPTDEERADVLMDINYNHMMAQRWDVSEALSTFLVRDKQLSETTALSAQLNVWQCQKRAGKWDRVKPEVESADYSAKGLVFQLARFALLERTEEFFSLLPRVIQAGDISEESLREWPIFSEMRESALFDPYRTSPRRKRRAPAARRKRADSHTATEATEASTEPA